MKAKFFSLVGQDRQALDRYGTGLVAAEATSGRVTESLLMIEGGERVSTGTALTWCVQS